jgi:fatty acid desaturase
MSAKTIRRAFRHEFKDLPRHSVWSAGAILGGYLTAIAGSVLLGAQLIAAPGFWSALGVAALIVFIATRLRGLNNIVHECCHYTFTDTIPANVVFGRVAAVAILATFRDYASDHATHHSFLGDHEQDKDFENRHVFGIDQPVTRASLLRHAMTPLTLQHIRRYFPVDLSFNDGQLVGLAKYAVLAAVAAGLWLAPWTTLLMVVVPYLYVFTAINYWNDCVDHAGLIAEHDDLMASRNLILPGPLRWLLFPRNDCYHLVHHLFPSIPVQHLPVCHRRLLSDPAYAALRHQPRWPRLTLGRGRRGLGMSAS